MKSRSPQKIRRKKADASMRQRKFVIAYYTDAHMNLQVEATSTDGFLHKRTITWFDTGF